MVSVLSPLTASNHKLKKSALPGLCVSPPFLFLSCDVFDGEFLSCLLADCSEGQVKGCLHLLLTWNAAIFSSWKLTQIFAMVLLQCTGYEKVEFALQRLFCLSRTHAHFLCACWRSSGTVDRFPVERIHCLPHWCS